MSGERPSSTPGRWANTASLPRRGDVPRKVRNGMKLQSKLPPAPRGVVAAKWMHLLESHITPTELAGGLEYARAGQIINMDIASGVVTAHVQGMAARPHRVQLHFTPLSEAQWSKLIELMSGEAIHVANLLAGEVPPTIDKVFADAGAPLFAAANAVTVQCDCSLAGQCRHAASAGYLLMERLDVEPLQVFTLLGMSAEKVLDHLRHARSRQTPSVVTAQADALIPQTLAEVPSLEACMEEFWHAPSGAHAGDDQQAPVTHAPHALLRRLGPSPLQGRFPMVGLLASIYDTVSQAARRVRDESTPDQTTGNGIG